MSGFAGFVRAGGVTARRDALDAMVRVLTGRGPDAVGTWVDAHAALAHTLFRTTDESVLELQPMVLHDRFHFVGDVRLDGRADLIARVNHAGASVSASAPDAEVAFHAWLVWRDECASRMLGDFSFVVWDQAEQRLFGARDHFGVRPFYYAAVGDGLVFGNMLAAVRRHPDVPDDLDDGAIIDALVFRYFQDPVSTAFAAIRRLPGGHILTWRRGQVSVRRYWSGPAERPIRFRRRAEYVEQYRDLFTTAVSDRLRTDRVSVAMTGGLDSSSIAATAARLQRARGVAPGVGVDARTIVYDGLIPDRERYFAGLVAEAAGIPIHFTVADDRAIYERHADPLLQPPEPVNDPFRAMLADFYRGIAARSRVLLMGLDGDTFLCEVASDYLLARLRRGEVGEYVAGVAEYIRTRRALPPHRIRTTIRLVLGREAANAHAIPEWIDPAMRRRFDLDARWARRPDVQRGLEPGWPLRPRATTVLASPKWAAMFDRHDAEHLGAPLEARFPFADLRLVEFLLNIPAVPWCIDKYIARQAMVGVLPPAVLARPKSPLAGDTLAARLALGDGLPWASGFRPHPRLGRYVDAATLSANLERDTPAGAAFVETRALNLNEWLWYHLPWS